jgi:WXG100 family type VII secretion target
MATSSVKVTPAEVQGLISSVSEAVAQLTTQHGTVQAQGESTSGSWVGDAGNTFRSTLESWLSDDQRVISALSELENGLTAFLGRMVSAESEATQLAAKG